MTLSRALLRLLYRWNLLFLASAKRMNDEYDMDKVWGIVTDAEKWYFMECTLENERKPVFKLSKPLFVAYEDEGMKDMAEKVLGHILWLLEEAQKPVKALEESREIKRVRSGELPKV